MRHDSKHPGGASNHISTGLVARDVARVLCLAEVRYMIKYRFYCPVAVQIVVYAFGKPRVLFQHAIYRVPGYPDSQK